jgi:autotransporter-associated beta strand protein
MKLKTKHSTIGHYAIMVVLFALAMEMKGFAQTYTFINSAAGTDAWNDTGNWDVNGVPVGSTSAAINLFSDISSPLGGNITVNSDPASLTLNSLTLNGLANASAATTVTLGTSGNVWTFGGATPAVTLGGMNNTGGSLTLTLQPNIALTQDLTIGGNGNAAFIFNGAISGARNLIKNGTSTLILNGANTYGSNTIVNGGTLIQNGGTLYSTNGSLNIGTTGANNLIIITRIL